ncbi:Sec1-like protein [Cinara cedri]|uniref:Sec1-like protein n=1 Tax=Cinara cedri TaxID=506608 RepID=A0A5E4M3P0_9HEMI|nr:Sec1-like protein [Cinara cedri]
MWRSKTKSNTGLKAVVRQIIINDVIKPNSIQKGTDNKNHRVLVVDQLGTKILSSCCSMCDICDEGIILVEDLFKAREQLNAYEAVYFITPNETSINALMDDFSNKKKLMYKAAHVFSLNCHDMFQTHYNPLHRKNIRSKINHIAQQIATVCLSLGEYPSVRYRSYYDSTVLLAQAVQAKLDAYRVDYPSIGQGLGKTRSQLIVLDRGFDCMSPILHELTYQSMVCDNLSITDNVYK